MKLNEIFKTAIETGIKNDPRKERVQEVLSDNKKAYEKEEKKENLRESMLWNPYGDSNILYGDGETEIKRIMVGIDTEAQELILADRLKDKGKQIDLVFGHHPEGFGLLDLYKMVRIQEDILLEAGVSVSTAEKIINESFTKYSRTFMPLNYNRAVDTARILDIPFLTMHTPADNCCHTFLENLMREKNPAKLKNIIDILMEIEEYKLAAKDQNGPKIVSGSPESRVGKIYIDVTGGTEASDKVYEKMEMAGVGTIIGMHMSEGHLEKAKKYNINVVMAGHMSSDSLGMNIILDEIEKKERFEEIIELSGFKRVRRI